MGMTWSDAKRRGHCGAEARGGREQAAALAPQGLSPGPEGGFLGVGRREKPEEPWRGLGGRLRAGPHLGC